MAPSVARSRAVSRATSVAVDAVSWMTPTQPAGRSIICRSQSGSLSFGEPMSVQRTAAIERSKTKSIRAVIHRSFQNRTIIPIVGKSGKRCISLSRARHEKRPFQCRRAL